MRGYYIEAIFSIFTSSGFIGASTVNFLLNCYIGKNIEARQLLEMGNCQSNDFDAQIAGTSITLIQYKVLTLRYRFDHYESMGHYPLYHREARYFIDIH